MYTKLKMNADVQKDSQPYRLRANDCVNWQRAKGLAFKCSFACKLWILYLQVFSDGVRWTVGDHENSIGLADHSVGNLD